MSDIEIQDAMGKLRHAACYGNYEESDNACRICQIRAKCADSTKRKVKEENDSIEKSNTKKFVNPLDHLKEKCGLRYQHAEKETDQAKADYYKVDGKVVLSVIVSKSTSRIKIQSPKGSRIFDKLESIQQVDDILAELL